MAQGRLQTTLLGLETKLPTQDNAPVAPVAEVATKVSAVHIHSGVTVVVLIEGVEEGGRQPEFLVLPQPEILPKGQVCIPEAWTAERVLTQVAITQRVRLDSAGPGEDKWAGSVGRVDAWHQERRVAWVESESAEVAGDRIKRYGPVRVEVRTVADGAAIAIGVDAGNDRERLTRLHCRYSRNLPTTEDLPQEAIVSGEPRCRNFIDVIRDEAVSTVENRQAFFVKNLERILRSLRRRVGYGSNPKRLVVVTHVPTEGVGDTKLQPTIETFIQRYKSRVVSRLSARAN